MHLRVVGQNAVIVNFPVPIPRGTRAQPPGRLRRPPRAAGARSRGDRRSTRSRSRSSCMPRAALHLQQPELLVSAEHRHRLRHGAAARSPCRRSTTPSPAARRPAPPAPRARPGAAGRARRARCSSFNSDRPLRYLAVRDQPVQRRDDRRTRCCRRADDRHGAGEPPRGTGRSRRPAPKTLAVAHRAGQPAPGLARPRHRRARPPPSSSSTRR